MTIEETVRQMAESADADKEYSLRCIMGEKVFFVEHIKALRPGHIYSSLGVKEYDITRMCEYHFDEATYDPDEEEIL